MSLEASIPYSTWEKWFFCFPIDPEGIPTSSAAYRLIRYLFENRNHALPIQQLADTLVLHPELVRCMCQQLEVVDLVFQEPAHTGHYRYRLRSGNIDLQAKVEASLIDDASCTGESSRPFIFSD